MANNVAKSEDNEKEEKPKNGKEKLPKLLIFVSICLLFMGLRNLYGVEYLMSTEGITYFTLIWLAISLLEIFGSLLILYRKKISLYISALSILLDMFTSIAAVSVGLIWALSAGMFPDVGFFFIPLLSVLLLYILWIKRGYLKEELNPVAKEDAEKHEENKRNWGVDILAAFFIGRGLVNIITLLYWGKPFDVSFLEDMSRIALESLFIISGIGVYRREQWGFFLGLFVCAVAALMAADENWFKRWNNRALSFVMIVGLDRFRPYFKKVRRRDWVVAGVLILLFVGVYGYEKTRPSKMEVYDHWTEIAVEKRDPMVCFNIEGLSYRGQCIQRVNSQLRDPALCELIESISVRDSCYSVIARRLHNKTYCEKINERWRREACIEREEGR